MRDDDKLSLILNKIMEVSERTARIETKVESMEQDITFIKDEDRKQNDLLDTHIQGTVTNRERLNLEIKSREDLEKKVGTVDTRVEKLETFPKFLKSFKAVLLYIAACTIAVYEIGRVIGKW